MNSSAVYNRRSGRECDSDTKFASECDSTLKYRHHSQMTLQAKKLMRPERERERERRGRGGGGGGGGFAVPCQQISSKNDLHRRTKVCRNVY